LPPVELPLPKWNELKLNSEIFISAVIFDRNSQVCSHKIMPMEQVGKLSRARGHARAAT
jgi:hypothetical protein